VLPLNSTKNIHLITKLLQKKMNLNYYQYLQF